MLILQEEGDINTWQYDRNVKVFIKKINKTHLYFGT